MIDYTPDKWIMIKLTNQENESHYRIFACWYGGYLGSDSWQMNSGVTEVSEDEQGYHFKGSSGSVYHCNKRMYGTSGYGQSVLIDMIEKSKEKVIMKIMPEDVNFMELDYGN